MKRRQTSILIGLAVGLLIVAGSCTNLTEKPYDKVTTNNFFKTDQQNTSALIAAYTQLQQYASTGNFNDLQEVSTDEEVIPQRGSDWYDGGRHIRLQLHTWSYKDDDINGAWTFLFGGVSTCNRLISQFGDLAKNGQVTQAQADSYTAELKVMRAFYYYWLLDLFGNVPIIRTFKTAPKAPFQPSSDFQTGRDSVFNFVESQIKDNINQLSRSVDQNTYGRMTVWGAHFLLMKLYLNADVYTGTPRWQDCISQADSIINSGDFHLASNFFDNFVTNNSGSPEFIFAIPYDHVYLQGFNMVQGTLHYLSQFTFNLKSQPWNGYATLEDFYNSFQKNDARKQGFLVGYQKSSTGAPLIDNAAFASEPHGDTLYFTPEINQLYPDAWRESGARFHKFEYAFGSTSNLDNDFPVFRYTDVLLSKAEAMWRLAGAGSSYSDANALNLVNMVRERAGLADYTSLDAYKLLLERGHEFYTEMWRREDLIRFRGGLHYQYASDGTRGAQYPAGTQAFNDAWWPAGKNSLGQDINGKSTPDPSTHVNVYPIPFNQMQANSNLKQNPGY